MEATKSTQSKNHSDYVSQREERLRNADSDLGIDNEVVLVKRRRAVAKLDDNLLLSPAGIPKLRRMSNKRLKLHGKGHEFSNVTQILKLYQLWLDDMYPRAKFSDGLSIIEKLGHSKRVQLYRKQWIDEGKPNRLSDQHISIDHIDNNVGVNAAGASEEVMVDKIADGDLGNAFTAAEATDLLSDPLMNVDRESSVPDADELDMLLRENS